MAGALTLDASYYEALKRLTLELAGVNLGTNHAFLVETRLARLAREEGYVSLEAMVDELFKTGKTRLAVQIVSALTERDTHFFKDRTAFHNLRKHVLPDLHHKRGGGRIRLLSFGCASGQETYGMAMTVAKMRDELDGLKVDIVGVDYPSQALERARAGRYTHFDVQRGLPIQDLVDFFDPDGADWVVKSEIREAVEFRDIHLLSKLDTLEDFHAVMFCGSLPHYSAPARVRVLRGLSGLVREHGYLILGEGENLAQMNYGFDRVLDGPGLYQKREVIIEPEIDPDAKVPTDKTTFEKSPRRKRKLAGSR
ncbi:CheR family methyltransferase [Litorimonas sp. WD9-15]|uniref:CheR family methyltransferase n=1 Tax=Litorimonas sp. WD9-15 TaxID=3418716 RepID=UPI003D0153AD